MVWALQHFTEQYHKILPLFKCSSAFYGILFFPTGAETSM